MVKASAIVLAVVFALIAAFFLTAIADKIEFRSGVGSTETKSGAINDDGIFNCSSRAAARKFSSRKECEDYRIIWQIDKAETNQEK
jgi:hypothetical protein